MHELSITESILNTSLAEAQKQNAKKIRVIRLLLGPFSGIVPDCIQMYLDLLSEGTIAEGAKVEATVLPLKIRCRDCQRESEITRAHIACPFCGSKRLQHLSGNECLIESLEVDIDEKNPADSARHGAGCGHAPLSS